MFMIGQIHLTAIMTLLAGMPQVVCACSSKIEPTAISQPVVLASSCQCCGSCANSSPESGSGSCCRASELQKILPDGNPLQVRGKGCTKVEALSKIPGILPTKTSKLVEALSLTLAFTPAAFECSLQFDSQSSGFRWTGHAPAPPGDLVTSLQRLLI
jgi:hypothetical protein